MWPFHRIGQREIVQEVEEAPVVDNTDKVKQWINCGIVSKHRPRVFVETQVGSWWFSYRFIFECQRCGFKITKTRKQLSPAERNALIALGYTDLRKDKKNAKPVKNST